MVSTTILGLLLGLAMAASVPTQREEPGRRPPSSPFATEAVTMPVLPPAATELPGRAWSGKGRALGLEGRDAEPEGDAFPITTVPEPMSLTLLATGLVAVAGVGLLRRRGR